MLFFLILLELVLSCTSGSGLFYPFKGTETRLPAQLRWNGLVQYDHPVPSLFTLNRSNASTSIYFLGLKTWSIQ